MWVPGTHLNSKIYAFISFYNFMWQMLDYKNKTHMQIKSFHNKKYLHNITNSPLLGYGLFESWCISAKEYRRSISIKQNVIWLVI